MREKKRKPIRPLVAPDIVVGVPRAVADWYWCRPWAEVLVAGMRQDDGLIVRAVADDRPDVAYLAEGQGDWIGRTVLHKQNW